MISILSRVGVSARRMQAAASAYAANKLDGRPDHSMTMQTEARWQTIQNRFQIEHVLRRILDTRYEVTLTGSNGQGIARTRIVGIDSAVGGHLLIECVANSSIDDTVPTNSRVNLASRFLELPILCSVDISQTVWAEGKPCYRSPLPRWLMFSEMRDSMRIRPPEDQPVRLRRNLPSQTNQQAQVIDISEGGIGLLLPQQPSYLPVVGERWHQTILHSGDEAITLELELLHVSRHCNGGHRIGATIHPATHADQQHLHHLIIRHQLLFADLS